MNSVTQEILTQRIKQLGNLPAMPSILASVCDTLSMPASKIDVYKIEKTISYDKSLTAQCLRMANSALFRQRGDVGTVREAVLLLGLWRIRNLAFSCTPLLMFPNLGKVVRRDFFWRHALGVAQLAQKLGHELGDGEQEQTYLAGLLHDIGILVNGVLFPEDFRDVLDETVRDKTSIEVVEQRILGFTHNESGKILAEWWRLPVEISEVIEFHHNPAAQKSNNEITLLVHVADLLCWTSELGYGYMPAAQQKESMDQAWEILRQRFRKASNWSREQCATLLASQLTEACVLADHVFSPALTAK